jgi:hypothetical protein
MVAGACGGDEGMASWDGRMFGKAFQHDSCKASFDTASPAEMILRQRS